MTMPDKANIKFAATKQDRSNQTLEDILEAASNLLEQAEPELLTSRLLAAKSGYSLGTLNKRLISVENVFIWLIEQGQKKYIQEATQIIDDFDLEAPLQVLVETLIDKFFTVMEKINPKVIRYYEHRMALKIGFYEDYDLADAMVKPFLAAARKNLTNTFRELNESEMQMILRSALCFVERPFIYDNPIAGTMEHRRIAVENIVRMLGR
jgi:AcrR family transcriptional regulator